MEPWGIRQGPSTGRSVVLLPASVSGGFCPFSSPEDLALAPAWPVEIELSLEVLRTLSTIGSVLSAK